MHASWYTAHFILFELFGKPVVVPCFRFARDSGKPGFTRSSVAAELRSSLSKTVRHAVRDRWGAILASCRFCNDRNLFSGFSHENFAYFLAFLPVLPSSFPHFFALRRRVGKPGIPSRLRKGIQEGRPRRKAVSRPSSRFVSEARALDYPSFCSTRCTGRRRSHQTG